MIRLRLSYFLEQKMDRRGEGGLRVNGYYKKSLPDKPLISVITVVYNGEAYLEETINSVINQEYDNVEYIIIDGGSTDRTVDIIKQYESAIDYWISEKDKGIYDAINKGITCSTGDVIGVLNCGDYYTKSALGIVANYYRCYPEVDFFFGPVDKSGIRRKYIPWLIHFTFRFYTTHSAGFFIRRTSQKRVGYYNLQYSCSADYDLFYRLIVIKKMKGMKISTCGVLGIFRPGGYSDSVSFIEHLREETRIRLDNGQNKLIVYFIHLTRLLKNIKKYKKIYKPKHLKNII